MKDFNYQGKKVRSPVKPRITSSHHAPGVEKWIRIDGYEKDLKLIVNGMRGSEAIDFFSPISESRNPGPAMVAVYLKLDYDMSHFASHLRVWLASNF